MQSTTASPEAKIRCPMCGRNTKLRVVLLKGRQDFRCKCGELMPVKSARVHRAIREAEQAVQTEIVRRKAR